MRNSRSAAIVMAVLAVLAAPAASAQPVPGAPDLRFGASGQVLTADPAWQATVAGAVAVDRLGRILVAGGTWDGHEHLTVLRYLPNGGLDPSFGAGGLVRTKTAPTSGTNHAQALVIQPDGKILAAGIGLDPSTTSDFGAALVRYLPDGALDPAFGTNGIVVTRVGTFTSGADAVALQPDGKVVVAATGFSGSTTDDDVVVLRYTPDGILDPSFGAGGVVNLTITSEQWARGVAVTATGRILVSARTGNGTMLVRLRSTGELDDTFGGSTGVVGIVGVPGEGLVLQPDGRIVVPGMAAGGTLGAARYVSTGSPDAAFGTAGVAGSGFSGGGDDAAVQENGKIVVVGGGGPFLRQYPLLWRANADGTPDSGFQATGPDPAASPRASFNAVVLLPDGKIVAVGRADPDGQGEPEAFLLARFHGDPTDLIFKDGFDLGSFVAWSSSVTADANLAADASVALHGTPFGLRAFVDEPTPLHVQDDSPVDEDRYRARFYLDPHDFDPGEAQDHRRARTFVVFSENPGRRLAAIVLRRLSGAYAVMGRARLDDNTQADTGWTPIGAGPHRIELDLKRSSGPDANDGRFRLWVDGAMVADLGALDNSLSAADFVRLGALSLKGGAVGTLSWDQFESRRQGAIGP
jgi:uncharacterized delta-60 repeat protein